MLKTVKQILDLKGHEVLSIEQEASLYDALTKMAENNVGALAVLDKGSLVGIISERDYARKVELCSESCHLVKVDDVMSRELYLVKPETTVEQAMVIVTESRCRHLPVMDGEEMIGLVSIGDLVKASLDEKDFVITQLNKYIKGEH